MTLPARNSRIAITSWWRGQEVTCHGTLRDVSAGYEARGTWIDLVVEFDGGLWAVIPMRLEDSRLAEPVVRVEEVG